MKGASDNPVDRLKADKHETIGGVLAAALNMEDQISSGVYEDYLDRKNWPAQLDEGAFREIRKRLHILIDDTREHRKILEALVRDYGQNR